MNRNELFVWARQQFGAMPEYLWQSRPGYAVLRSNGKWFAIVMDVPRDRLGLPGSGQAEILNVKCDPLLIGSLRQQPGFLPAYHMNKSSWISILLDGSVADSDIQALVTLSHAFTLPKKRNPPRS